MVFLYPQGYLLRLLLQDMRIIYKSSTSTVTDASAACVIYMHMLGRRIKRSTALIARVRVTMRIR
jgi:hypothetical protein